MKSFMVAVALFSTAAFAQGQNPLETYHPPPSRGSFAILVGGYRPDIASEPSLSGDPYSQSLGAGSMLLVQLEFDKFLWHKIGAAGFGFTIGYGEKYGKAVAAGGATTDEKTALKVLPMRLFGLYRFDYPALRWSVPIVPYVKLGLAYTPWWSIKGSGVEYFNGKRGAGGKWGWTGDLGMMLLLDVLEPGVARDFDTDLGVKHSYLFAEYAHDKVNGFGGDGLDLSANHWSFGLAFDY